MSQDKEQSERNDMTNEEFVRQAYATAEVKDIPGWIACFNADGAFVDQSVGVTYRGPDLLRMKGILNVKDTDKPVVIHGVQHVFHPPATLEAWPEGDDRKSRVVFITRDIAESTIRKVFASFFEAEKKGWSQQEQQQQ